MNKLRLFLLIALLSLANISLAESNDLFPFVLPWDDNTKNITDVSSWNKKPIGKEDCLSIKNGHIYSDSKRIKFIGVNMTFSANFPNHYDAEKIAQRMAKFGINCVRFHHMDTRAYPDGLLNKDFLSINQEQIDKLDYFIYQLKQNGIYSDINLHVARKYPNLPKWDGMPEAYKGVDLFYPDMINMQKNYAKDILTHLNPYTGLKYVEDPCIAVVEINNENSLIREWWALRTINRDNTPSLYISELEYQWNKWLQRKYIDNALLNKKWKTLNYTIGNIKAIEPYDKINNEIKVDWIQFLVEKETNYYNSMYDYIKNNLHSKSLIIGTQNCFSPFITQKKMDIIDSHSYWQHPVFPGRAWDLNNWYINNISMTGENNGGCISELAQFNVVNKPFFVTEYNHSAPNTFSSETFLLLSAYAAFQDWDGIFAFDYMQIKNYNSQKINGFFDISQNPSKMSSLIPSFALFRRMDVKPAKEIKSIFVPDKEIIDKMVTVKTSWISTTVFGLKGNNALKHRIGFSLFPLVTHDNSTEEVTNNNVINSDTNELFWDKQNKNLIIDTPLSKAFIGRAERNKIIRFKDDISIKILKTKQDWAAITMTQMNCNKFNNNILITATGYNGNTDMKWNAEQNSLVENDWGTAPTIIEGIDSEIRFSGDKEIHVWALDEKGNRKEEVPITKLADSSIINIAPIYKTLWYELDINNK
ncbi:MAG: hypothetical protein WCK67_11745 [bacterium]